MTSADIVAQQAVSLWMANIIARGLTMGRKVYRYRKCPKCAEVFPAGKLGILNYHGNHYHKWGGSLRKCMYCGHTGFTQDFKVVKL